MKIAIISDIHEDIISLRKAINKIERHNCDKIVCLGDISGYSVKHYNHFESRNAHACLELVREYCDIVIPGNHDLNIAKRISLLSDGFQFPNNWFELDYYQKKEIAGGKVWLYEEEELNPLYSKEDVEYLLSISEYYIIPHETGDIFLSHYLFPNILGCYSEFYLAPEKHSRHFDFIKTYDCKLAFVGHTHPSGIMITQPAKMTFKRFNNITLNHFPVIVSVPSVVKAKNRNGFIIYDTDTLTLRPIKI